MGLLIFIFIIIVFAILKNMDEISNLKEQLEFEGEHVKSLESQLELEIETRKKENTTFSEEIQAIKKFLPNSTIG